MKVSPRDIEGFLKNPLPGISAVLIYGPDEGLIRSRMKTLGHVIVSDLNDPFNVVELNGADIQDDPARLSDELNAMSMMGGRRLIMVRQGSDKITKHIKESLAEYSGENFLIIESDNLTPKSSLRKLCEAEKNMAAIPCYVENERDLSFFVSNQLRQDGYQIDRNSVAFIVENVLGNRSIAEQEIEKLETYMGDEKNIDFEDVAACIGQSAAISLDDFIASMASGQTKPLEPLVKKLFAEGVMPITLIRTAQNHFRRLYITKSRMNRGENFESASKKLSPPLFFKTKPLFQQQLHLWTEPGLKAVLENLSHIESECKKTGTPAELLCTRSFFVIAQRAKSKQRR